jgi:hypothetical protein
MLELQAGYFQMRVLVHVGAQDPQDEQPDFVTAKLQIISTVLFTFSYAECVYTEGHVHIKVKCNHIILVSLKFRF